MNAPNQPATRFVVDVLGIKRYWVRNKPTALIPCLNCGKAHQARHMVVQVYIDAILTFCREGRGCRGGQ